MKQRAFTLIELVMVMAIMTVIAVIAFTSLSGYRERQSLRSVGQQVEAALRDAQNRSLSGEGGIKWGVHFDNTSSSAGFYSIFSGASYSTSSVVSQIPLPLGMRFTNPAEGKTIDISFYTLTGRAGGNNVISVIKNNSNFGVSNIIVQSNGRISFSADEGLVGYWPFDEGAGATSTDASGYGNTGTLINGPAWYSGASCKLGNCLNFDGLSNYISIPNASALNPTAAITVSAWFLAADISGQITPPIVKKADASAGYAMEVDNSSLTLRFYVFIGGAWRGSASSAPLVTGQWHHAAGTYDGSDIRLYLNGQQVMPAVSQSGAIVGATNPLNIGRDPVTPARFWDGRIDDVRIYNRALSATEVLSLYNTLK